MNVVIVDDDEQGLELLRRVVEEQTTFDVAGQAMSCEQALDLVDRRAPDVVLSDIDIAGTDGISLAAAIKSRFPNIHVVLVADGDQADVEARARAAGASGLLIKPDLAALMPGLDEIARIGPDRRRGDRARVVWTMWPPGPQAG